MLSLVWTCVFCFGMGWCKGIVVMSAIRFTRQHMRIAEAVNNWKPIRSFLECLKMVGLIVVLITAIALLGTVLRKLFFATHPSGWIADQVGYFLSIIVSGTGRDKKLYEGGKNIYKQLVESWTNRTRIVLPEKEPVGA